jgi:hypothetical protein
VEVVEGGAVEGAGKLREGKRQAEVVEDTATKQQRGRGEVVERYRLARCGAVCLALRYAKAHASAQTVS